MSTTINAHVRHVHYDDTDALYGSAFTWELIAPEPETRVIAKFSKWDDETWALFERAGYRDILLNLLPGEILRPPVTVTGTFDGHALLITAVAARPDADVDAPETVEKGDDYDMPLSSVPPAILNPAPFWYPNVFGEAFRGEQVVYGQLEADETGFRRVEMGLRGLPAMPSMLALAAWVAERLPGWEITHAQYGSPYMEHLAKTTLHIAAFKRQK